MARNVSIAFTDYIEHELIFQGFFGAVSDHVHGLAWSESFSYKNEVENPNLRKLYKCRLFPTASFTSKEADSDEF